MFYAFGDGMDQWAGWGSWARFSVLAEGL